MTIWSVEDGFDSDRRRFRFVLPALIRWPASRTNRSTMPSLPLVAGFSVVDADSESVLLGVLFLA